jgi:DNA-binding protein H-NS
MTKTYAQIQKQIAALQRDAEKLKRQEVDGVIARIKEAIQVYGLTASDLGLDGTRRKGKPGPKPGSKRKAKGKPSRAAKYRDEAGNTWVGRGPRPQWLRDALAAGKSLQDFAV